MKPTTNKVPKHIGIILDGNRRFARRLLLKPWKGHEWGAKKTEKVVEWCKNRGIKEVTLYGFSIENFDRPKVEFNYIVNIFKKECDRYLKKNSIVHKNKVRMNFIGRIHMFPKDLQEKIHKLMEATKNYKGIIVNVALAYGGRAEIIDATKKIAEQIKKGKLDIKKINEEIFSKNLYVNSDPDLIIRTGGEQRVSGFLLWQGVYAELYFCEKLWPDFEEEDLQKAINDYQNRHRRFGR